MLSSVSPADTLVALTPNPNPYPPPHPPNPPEGQGLERRQAAEGVGEGRGAVGLNVIVAGWRIKGGEVMPRVTPILVGDQPAH